jgi:phosphoglycerate dehydrogenase-like enzyme
MTADTYESAEEVMDQVEVLLCWRFPALLFASASRLRWVQSMGAGVEDILAAPELPRDITITRVVDQFGGPIAEYVFAELLARVRRLEELREAQRRRAWIDIESDTLAGKTIGVAGLGSIGKEIVRKARAFDMKVHGLSRTLEAASLVDQHFTPDSWSDFVRELDFPVLTLPLTRETEGVVDVNILKVMPRRTVLVNVGRGKLVVEADLILAVKTGEITGAILDVFSEEPLPPDNPLWELPGVTVTPHVSGPSTVEGVGAFFLRNLERYLRHNELIGVVDPDRGY